MKKEILFSAVLALLVVANVQAVWDVEYSGNVNPWTASPAWTGSNGGSPLPAWGPAVTAVADPYFIIDTSVNNGQTENFTITGASGNWNADLAGVGVVAEVVARVFDGTNLGHALVLGDGTNNVQMQFWSSPTQVSVRMNGSIWSGLNVTPGEFHTFRLEIFGSDVDLIVDGSPIWSGNTLAGGSDSIWWGDGTTGGAGLVHYSEVRWEYVPEPMTMLLLGSGAAWLIRRKRQ